MPDRRRLFLTHVEFPSRSAAEICQIPGIETVSLPRTRATADLAFAPLHQPETRFIIDSEQFLQFRSSLPASLNVLIDNLCDKANFRLRINQAQHTIAIPRGVYDRADLLARVSWQVVAEELGPTPDGLVVKPARGFASDSVFVCRTSQDWQTALDHIRAHASGRAPMTDMTRFVVEPYIAGQELAIDVYVRDDGTPVILGIYLHPFRDPADVRDIVYRTSRQLTRQFQAKLQTVMTTWSKLFQLRNMAIHAEVRITPEGKVFAIEFNPFRFGSLTADIALYAYGANPYATYFHECPAPPDILPEFGESDIGMIVAPLPDHGHGAITIDQEKFRTDLIARGLTIHRIQILPHDLMPFFAVAYVSGAASDMDHYLAVDFADYVIGATSANPPAYRR